MDLIPEKMFEKYSKIKKKNQIFGLFLAYHLQTENLMVLRCGGFTLLKNKQQNIAVQRLGNYQIDSLFLDQEKPTHQDSRS